MMNFKDESGFLRPLALECWARQINAWEPL